jgi:hypothetical protein
MMRYECDHQCWGVPGSLAPFRWWSIAFGRWCSVPQMSTNHTPRQHEGHWDGDCARCLLHTKQKLNLVRDLYHGRLGIHSENPAGTIVESIVFTQFQFSGRAGAHWKDACASGNLGFDLRSAKGSQRGGYLDIACAERYELQAFQGRSMAGYAELECAMRP